MTSAFAPKEKRRPKHVWPGSVAAVALATGASIASGGAAHAQAVTDQTLSDLRIERVGTCKTLTVEFNIRLQILSYYPSQPGRELHIRVRPLDATTSLAARDALRPPSNLPELRSIEYAGNDPAGPLVSLYFDRDMQFEVDGGAEPDTLIVKLYEPRQNRECSSAAGPISDAPVAAPSGIASAADAPGTEPVPRQSQDSAALVPPGLYIVNAISSPGPLKDLTSEQEQAIAGRVAYDSTVDRDGEEWHRLRIGFFETKKQADEAAKQLARIFPAAWAMKITPEERAEGIANRVDTGELARATPRRTAIVASPEQSAEVERLIADAETALAEGDNNRAVQLLTNARALPEAAQTARAIELLGLTRERMGQKAQAEAEFEEYIVRYPEGDGTERVKQRLAALSGTGTTTVLRQADDTSPTAWSWEVRGSFSQFYFRDQSRSQFIDTTLPDDDLQEQAERRINLNQLLTSADIAVSAGNDRTQIEIRGSGSYAANFRSGGRDRKAITALYIDAADTVTGIQGRLGRQTRNSGGVFGRFDGGWLAFQASDKLKINGVAGFPVITSRQTKVLTDRHFYGISLDYGARSDMVRASVYIFNQQARGGLVDRRSIGTELRFRKDDFNAFGLIDYDIHHGQVNLALATLAYTAPDRSNISVTADYRRSPLLTTTNALIGQVGLIDALPFTDLRDLLLFYSPEELYELARDRTLTSKSLTMAYSKPLTEKLQANFDVTLTEISGSPLIPATVGTQEIGPVGSTGTEYYFGAQVVGTGFFWDNDVYILSGRYADTQRSRSFTIDFNARAPLTDKIRLSPRLRFGRRESKLIDDRYTQIQPSLRVNYYPFRHGEFEIEAGMNFASQRTRDLVSASTFDETSIILTVGYRLDF